MGEGRQLRWLEGNDRRSGRRRFSSEGVRDTDADPADCPDAPNVYYAKEADEPKAATDPTDPTYFQAGIAYTFGDTTVSASWYNSEDFENEGSTEPRSASA